MLLKDLTIDELKKLMWASEDLIEHYGGDINEKLKKKCILCTIAYEILSNHEIDLSKKRPSADKCNCCPWTMLESIQCMSLTFDANDLYGPISANLTYNVDDVRWHPETCEKQAAFAVERHERWVKLYQAELDRR